MVSEDNIKFAQNFRKSLYKHPGGPDFLSHFQKHQEDSVITLASTKETQLYPHSSCNKLVRVSYSIHSSLSVYSWHSKRIVYHTMIRVGKTPFHKPRMPASS